MKIIRTSLLAFVLLFFVTSCSKDDSLSDETNYSIDLNLAQETDWLFADDILALINEHRTSIGLSTIERDQQYASAYAVEHTKYMIENNRVNHDNFGSRSAALKNKGAKRVGENVAYGYETADKVVYAWLHSPAHKDIIEGDYTHSGFGVMQNDSGRFFFTQIFYSK